MSYSRKDQQEMTERTRVAAGFISTLRPGDAVVVTQDGRDLEMTVSRGPSRCDGAYGSWESIRVTVTLGPGRYSTEVGAEHVARGRMSIRRAQ